MKGKKTKQPKMPKGYVYNPELDKYADKVLFPKKVEEINRILKEAGLPKKIMRS